MKSFIVLAGALVLVLSACSSSESVAERNSETTTSATSTTTDPSGPRVLVTIEEIGGCFMMGPNCATYVVYSNGLVDLQRTMEPGEPVATTMLDVALIKDLTEQLATTDFDTLRARLPAGQCQSCVDGIDTTLTYETPSGPVSLSSIDVELPLAEPLFAPTWAIRNAAANAMELPMLQRP